ncbi:MAG: hypothetical protein ACOCV1_01550 [Bacillota bacterium]
MSETLDHLSLKRMSALRLVAMGYKIGFEVSLEGGGKIDVVGVRKLEDSIGFKAYNIGIECLTKPNENIILNKVKKYKEYFDSIIIVTFRKYKKDLKKIKDKNIKIWYFPNTSNNKKSAKLYEYFCKDCYGLFYTPNVLLKTCPFCLKNSLEINYISNDYNEYMHNVFDTRYLSKRIVDNISDIKINKKPGVYEDGTRKFFRTKITNKN